MSPTLVLATLALVACDVPPGSAEVSQPTDPYDFDLVFDQAFNAGRALTEEESTALRFAPELAGMRIDAAAWNRVCPDLSASTSTAPASDEMRQSDAMYDAGALGDLDALLCTAAIYEDLPEPLIQAEAYEALVLAELWGAEVSPERMARLEAAIGAERTATSRTDAQHQFDDVTRTLAYEREHGPIPPELARGHTYDDYLATNPTGINGPPADLSVLDDADDAPPAPEPDIVVE